jgi:hypothetical protein
MDAVFTVGRRFRGMFLNGEHYAHGGHFCGQVAQFAPGLPAVAIQRLIPLERELTVRVSAGLLTVLAGAEEIANSAVKDAPLPVTLPPPITLDEARAAEERFEGFTRHPFPECFACGHERAAGNGLRIFTGEVGQGVHGEKQLAGVWQPDPSVLDGDGLVRPEFVWAALDCPGGWAIPEKVATVALQVDILDRIPGDRPLIVRGWIQRPIESTRRSRYAGSAVLDETGRVLALSSAIWSSMRGY